MHYHELMNKNQAQQLRAITDHYSRCQSELYHSLITEATRVARLGNGWMSVQMSAEDDQGIIDRLVADGFLAERRETPIGWQLWISWEIADDNKNQVSQAR